MAIEDQLAFLFECLESSVQVIWGRPVHRWRLIFVLHRDRCLMPGSSFRQSQRRRLVSFLADLHCWASTTANLAGPLLCWSHNLASPTAWLAPTALLAPTAWLAPTAGLTSRSPQFSGLRRLPRPCSLAAPYSLAGPRLLLRRGSLACFRKLPRRGSSAGPRGLPRRRGFPRPRSLAGSQSLPRLHTTLGNGGLAGRCSG